MIDDCPPFAPGRDIAPPPVAARQRARHARIAAYASADGTCATGGAKFFADEAALAAYRRRWLIAPTAVVYVWDMAADGTWTRRPDSPAARAVTALLAAGLTPADLDALRDEMRDATDAHWVALLAALDG